MPRRSSRRSLTAASGRRAAQVVGRWRSALVPFDLVVRTFIMLVRTTVIPPTCTSLTSLLTRTCYDNG